MRPLCHPRHRLGGGAVKKNNNWDGHSSSTVDSPLVRIQCLDGYMEYDADAETWEEVKA